MRKEDKRLIIAIIIILALLTFLALNINTLFPTPNIEQAINQTMP